MNENNESDTNIEKDVQNLDVLDVNFAEIMNSLVNNESFSKFRTEYMNLLEAFKVSHFNNSELVKKCQSLNSEIISNTTKVSSVLKLSQEDQRIISGLRFEFEKAWKMVEISQDKENKSRDIIESLKAEVTKLSKLSEAGGAMAFSKENSLQSLQDDVAMLKKEINVQNSQINALNYDTNQWREKLKEAKSITEALGNEQQQLLGIIESSKSQVKDVEDNVVKIMNDVALTKENLRVSNEKIATNSQELTTIQQRIESTKQSMDKLKSENRENIITVEESLERVELNKQLLEGKIGLVTRTMGQLDEMQRKLSEKEKKVIIQKDRLSSLSQELNSSEIENRNANAQRVDVTNKLKEKRSQLNQCRSESFRLRHELSRLESIVLNSKRAISVYQNSLFTEKTLVVDEEKKRITIEAQQNSVQDDISTEKLEMHETHKMMDILLNEIQKHEETMSTYKSNTLIIEADRKVNDYQKQELDIVLTRLRNRIQKHDGMQKTLLEERDLVRRQLEALKQEAKQIMDDHLIISTEIHQSKEQIRKNDFDCIEIHHKCEQISESLPELQKLNIEKERGLQEVATSISTLYNTLVRSRYLHDVSENGLEEVKRIVTSLEAEKLVFETKANRRVAEVHNIRQKCKSLEYDIGSMHSHYNRISLEIEDLKTDLGNSISRQKDLIELSQHSRALFKENIKIEKSLLYFRCRAKALEEELETPMNIHRWRFLEGTNPEHMQLIKMNQSLKYTYLHKMCVLQRLRSKLDELSHQFEVFSKRLKMTITPEQEAAQVYYKEILGVKDRQLTVVQNSIDGQKSSVYEGRDSVELLREQLRDVKQEYFDIKKANNDIRTSIKPHKTTSSQPEQVQHYIGGGFSITSTAKSPTQSVASLGKKNIICIPSMNKPGRKSSSSMLTATNQVKKAVQLLPTQ